MTRRFISLFVVVLLIIKDVTGVITNGPSNAVAEAGGQAIFNCTSGTTFQNWIFAKSRDDLGTSFAQDIAINCVIQPGFETYYEVDRPGGSNNICNLIVKATTMQHAGIYTCTDSVYGPSAILTVIDSSSAMAINNTSDTIEKETVVFTCSINYNGSLSPAPTLRPHYYWKDVNGQNVSDFIEKLTENEIVSEISVTAGRQDIASYTCRLYLKLDPPVNDGYASNTPTVNNSASSPPIVVLYGAAVPSISTEYQIIEIDGIPCEVGVLTCNSTGNPQPSYVWRDTKENSNITTAATFDLAEINRNYTCVAINTIQNEIYEAKAFHVQTSLNNVKNCRFPRDESARHDVTGCDNGTCSCSNGYDGINLTCNAESYPNASFQWAGPDEIVIYSKVYTNITTNGIYRCTSYFDRSMTNYSGNVVFANGSSEANVSECLHEPEPPDSSTPRPGDNSTNITQEGTQMNSQPIDAIYVALALSVYEIANLISMGFFLAYYNVDTDTNTNGNNSKVGKTKIVFNRRFPWLEKMLPCMNEYRANCGVKCLWIFIFVLITISCGVFMFPILVIIVKSGRKDSRGSQENSQLNMRFDEIPVNVRGDNRFLPPPSSTPHPQRPIPPPNIPSRPPPPARSQQMIREGGAAEYAVLPMAKRPHLVPAEYLNDDEGSHYANLRRV